MQNVLGMNMQDTYMQMPNNNYFEPRMQDINLQEINKLYPEIYGIIYPMIQKACSGRNIEMLDDRQISEMVEEIYNAIEPGDDLLQGRETRENTGTKVKGVAQAKESSSTREAETRRTNNRNYLLRDLIRILIIRELLQGGIGNIGRPRPPMHPFGMQQMPMMGGISGMPRNGYAVE